MWKRSRALIFLLLLIHTASINATKWLRGNPCFFCAESWASDMPCHLDEVIFPNSYDAVLSLPADVKISGFALPSDGAILLDQDSTIDFGAESHQYACNDNHKAYLKRPDARKWYSPNSWYSMPDIGRNAAVPNMERIPCNNETVVIKREGALAIDLENVPFMRVGQLSLAGSIISKDYLKNLLRTDIGQILFQNSLGASVEYYRDDVCGCHKNFQHFVEPICHNVVDSCERPRCLNPILPKGSCCDVCGSLLTFVVEGCDDSNLHKLTKVISMAIADQGLAGKLDYHVSYIGMSVLQAVIVDYDTYSEKSVEFVKHLNKTTDWTKVFAHAFPVVLSFAGRPYNGGVTVGSILMIIFCMLFVAYVGLVITAHYAPDNRYVNMVPPWVLEPRRWPAFFTRSSVVFARFQNAGTGAVEANVENVTMRFNAQSGAMRERAFDNPMFKEGGQREEREQPQAAKEPLESVDIIPKVESVEEQELTEIKLDTSSDSSDEEETKE